MNTHGGVVLHICDFHISNTIGDKWTVSREGDDHNKRESFDSIVAAYCEGMGFGETVRYDELKILGMVE